MVERLILARILILPVRLALDSSINLVLLVLRGQRGVLIEGKAGGIVANCPHHIHVHRQPDRGQNHRHSWLHPPTIKRICSSLYFFFYSNTCKTIDVLFLYLFLFHSFVLVLSRESRADLCIIRIISINYLPKIIIFRNKNLSFVTNIVTTIYPHNSLLFIRIVIYEE